MGLFTNNPDNKKNQYSSSYTSENISDNKEYPPYYSVGLHRPNTVFASIERLEKVCAEYTALFVEARTSFNKQNSQYHNAITSNTIESAREQVEAARIGNTDQNNDSSSEVFIDPQGNFSDSSFNEYDLIAPPELVKTPTIDANMKNQDNWDLAA